MPRFIVAVPVWLVLWTGAATGQQSTQCALLSEMRQVDAALAAFATQGGSGGARIALAEALEGLRARGGVAAASGLPGFDADFVGSFASSRGEALNLAARGAGAQQVLGGAALQQTAERLGRLWVAFDCASEEERRAAAAVAELSEASEEGEVSTTARSGLSSGPRDVTGEGRFTRLKEYGGNPWRINGNPNVWLGLAVFLLVFAASATVLNWFRAAHHRRSERFPCALEVKLLHRRGRARARLVDLSHIGAKIRLEGPPQRGEQVVVAWKGISVAGRVVWANSHFAGLSFHHPLSSAACQTLLDAGRVGTPGYIPPPAAA